MNLPDFGEYDDNWLVTGVEIWSQICQILGCGQTASSVFKNAMALQLCARLGINAVATMFYSGFPLGDFSFEKSWQFLFFINNIFEQLRMAARGCWGGILGPRGGDILIFGDVWYFITWSIAKVYIFFRKLSRFKCVRSPRTLVALYAVKIVRGSSRFSVGNNRCKVRLCKPRRWDPYDDSIENQ